MRFGGFEGGFGAFAGHGEVPHLAPRSRLALVVEVEFCGGVREEG